MSLSELAAKWNSWAGRSPSRKLFGAATAVVVATLLVKAVATAKELAIAYQFGTGDALDAFLMALVLPSFAVNVVAGSFGSALLPVVMEVQENSGERAARELFGAAMVWALGLLAVVGLLLALSGSEVVSLIASGFGPRKLSLTVHLFRLLLPVVVLGGLATLLQLGLNMEERFAAPALAPSCVPLATILAVIVGAQWLGAGALVLGTVVGYAAEVLLLLHIGRKERPWLWPDTLRVTPALAGTFRQYLPKLAGAFLTSGTGVVDRSMASMLAAGSVAALGYGSRLVAVTVGVGTLALGTAALPHFSRLVARREWDDIRRIQRRWFWFIMLGSIPILALTVPLSRSIVALVFQRGAFTSSDTIVVARVQALYLLQLPFHVAAILFVRLVSALQENRFLAVGAVINLAVNIFMNWLLMRWMGVAGIALSTSIVYLVSFVYLGFVSRSSLRAAALAHY